MNFWAWLFLSCDFSSISSMRDTVESLYSFSAFTVTVPSRLTEPASTLSPTPLVTGIVSPVNDFISNCDVPFVITPSISSFSPGRIIIKSPIFTSSGEIAFSFSPSMTLTISTFASSIFFIDFLLLSSASPCKNSPIVNKNTTIQPSLYSPTANAPNDAIVISKFSLKISLCITPSTASLIISKPTIKYESIKHTKNEKSGKSIFPFSATSFNM